MWNKSSECWKHYMWRVRLRLNGFSSKLASMAVSTAQGKIKKEITGEMIFQVKGTSKTTNTQLNKKLVWCSWITLLSRSLSGRDINCPFWLIINVVAIFPAKPYHGCPSSPPRLTRMCLPSRSSHLCLHLNTVQTPFANPMQAQISLSDLTWPHFLLHIYLLDTRHFPCPCLEDHLL